MRLRRLELVILGVTLAFVCFMGGYFTGTKTAVNVVSVETQGGQLDEVGSGGLPNAGATVAQPGNDSVAERADADAGSSDTSNTAGQTIPQTGAPRDSDGRININTASRSELMDLPGIGSVLAGRIIDYRFQNGPFSRIEDLRNITGIGEKRFETIRDKVTVGG